MNYYKGLYFFIFVLFYFSGKGISVQSSTLHASGSLSMSMLPSLFPIDSHLHVWSNGANPYPYAQNNDNKLNTPPEELHKCQAEHLINEQNEAGSAGALIVQPINHGYDHSYVLSVMKKYEGKFKGMCLMNPTLGLEEGSEYLKQLHLQGFVGVRFNPYLWPSDTTMSDENGKAWFELAGKLNMPVGFMTFKGLPLHYDDIVALLQFSPNTKVIIDHWGFFVQNGNIDEDSWGKLLSLAVYKQVHVKISALFRVSLNGYPFQDLDERLVTLNKAFGSRRLLFGSDYPFVLQNCGYSKSLKALEEWPLSQSTLSLDDWKNIYRFTAEDLFGKWGKEVSSEL